MRRADREVADFNEILDILRRADTLRLGVNGGDYPYVVPLSFGFEAVDGAIVLYFHGAGAGRKHELLRRDPRVCVEADILHKYEETPGSYTARYESFIGVGAARRVTGELAAHGMDLLMEHCGFAGREYSRAELEQTAIYRIVLDSFTAKRNITPLTRA